MHDPPGGMPRSAKAHVHNPSVIVLHSFRHSTSSPPPRITVEQPVTKTVGTGAVVGFTVGMAVGKAVGEVDGIVVGIAEGNNVGLLLGA